MKTDHLFLFSGAEGNPKGVKRSRRSDETEYHYRKRVAGNNRTTPTPGPTTTPTYTRQSVCELMKNNRESLVEAIRAKDPRRALERDILQLEQFFPGYTVPGSKEVQRMDVLLLAIVSMLWFVSRIYVK